MLDSAHTALLVVDIQDKLFPPMPEVVESMLGASVKLILGARQLGLPIFAAVQNPEKLGGLNNRISEALGEVRPFPKMEFGCLANEGFRTAVEASGRRQLLVVGMETHVCVLQTVLAALEASYEVYVARDAILSMHHAQYQAGMERMIQAGAVPVTALMALFELLRAAGTPEFRGMLPLLK